MLLAQILNGFSRDFANRETTILENASTDRDAIVGI